MEKMTTQILVEQTIGSRIREKRKNVQLSIRELARRTSLTASFISQVENEKANVSIDSLRRISGALGVQILYFLTDNGAPPKVEPESEQPAAPKIKEEMPQLLDRSSPLVKKNMRARLFLPDSGITYELLTSRLDHKMEAFIGRIAPGAGNVAARLSIPTEEVVYCLAGSLKVGLRDQTYFLEEGDSIYIDGPDLTMLANASDAEVAVWLSVITPPAF
jgi:transcriptional regulator with XRE-family HTH domain